MTDACIDYHGPVVAFDLDDTLYQERDFAISGYRHVASMLAAKASLDADALTTAMTSALDCRLNPFDAIAPALSTAGLKLEEELPEMLGIYRDHVPSISLDGTTLSVLRKLQQAEVVMAIITDGRTLTQTNKIAALGMSDFVAPGNIFISEQTGFEKKTGRNFDALVRRYPEAGRFIYVGDNPDKDFRSANIRGWTTVCLLDQGHNIHTQIFGKDALSDPAFRIRSFHDLPEIITSLGSVCH